MALKLSNPCDLSYHQRQRLDLILWFIYESRLSSFLAALCTPYSNERRSGEKNYIYIALDRGLNQSYSFPITIAIKSLDP